MAAHEHNIVCYNNTKIYIFCPGGFATGGPEALHQLGHHLNKLGFNAFMHYFPIPEGRGKPVIHPDYVKYAVPVAEHVENKPEHLMILPEMRLAPIFLWKYRKVRKAVWWLSVVFYHQTQKKGVNTEKRRTILGLPKAWFSWRSASFDRLKRWGVLNIAHSHFSLVHLRENGIEPVGQISDYMNDTFFQLVKEEAAKENIIVYNPKKNDEFLQEIIQQTAEITWKPLAGMSPAEVAEWMNRAKVYVDFGYHPGKERMPREACIMRCCMVIGKTGSAAYAEDMPILEKYRFEKDEKEIPGIIACIKGCLGDYDHSIKDFEPYRKDLYAEKEKFESDIKRLFINK